MRTSIFVSSVLIAQSINSDLKLSETSINFYVILFFIFIIMDIAEFLRNKSRKIRGD